MIDTFIWSNGTIENPITLTESEMETLIEAGKNAQITTSVSGVYTTQSKTIRNYLYQVLHDLYPDLIKHSEVSITADDVQFSLNGVTSMNEGSSILVESTGNVPIEYLNFSYDYSSVSEGFTQQMQDIIRSRITTQIVDNGVGSKVLRLSIGPAQENISWSASLKITAYPSYLSSNNIPQEGDQNRHDEIIVIQGIRLNGVTIAGSYVIAPSSVHTYQVRPTNQNTTKLSSTTIYSFAISPNNTGLTPIPNDSATGDYGVLRKSGNNWIFTANALPSGETSVDSVLSVNVYLKSGEASVANASIQVTCAEGGNQGGDDEIPYLTGSIVLQEAEVAVGRKNVVSDIDSRNVINWIRNNSHIYIGGKFGTMSKMYLRQVSDNDKRYWASDNTLINIDFTQRQLDVFMKLPEFWYKVEPYTFQGMYQIFFSTQNPSEHNDNTVWQHWKGNTLIGVYEGSVVGGRLRSIPGQYPCVRGTNNNGYTAAQGNQTVNGVTISPQGYTCSGAKAQATNGGTGFHLISFAAHTIMALLGYALYLDVDIQAQCGRGTPTHYTYNNATYYLPRITGLCDELGMTDTSANDVDTWTSQTRIVEGTTVDVSGDKSVNFWGLENWWGNVAEWVDNVLTINSSRSIGIFDLGVTFGNNGTATLNGSSISPLQTVVSAVEQNSNQCITKMQFYDTNGDFVGLMPKNVTTDANYTTGYCASSYVAAQASMVAYRSSGSAALSGGLGCLSVYHALSGVDPGVGSRLLYELDTVDSELLIVDHFLDD